ncbi:MAG: hypothetical protein HPY66_1645 [Firmicutes bacterium]|nr:hypothetical protein [Bacillota bacterium]
MRKLGLIFMVFFVLLLPGCGDKGQSQPVKEPLSYDLQANQKPATVPKERITVSSLLNEFNDWEGKKDQNQAIYTLNLSNNTYILTINPQTNSREIKWAEMVYIKPIKSGATITTDEIKPLKKLASAISPYWGENTKWMDSITSGKIPYEESADNWKLKADYYYYQGKKEGLSLTISTLITVTQPSTTYQPSTPVVPVTPSASKEDKTNAWIFAQDAVKSALKAPSTAKFPWYDESYITPLSDGRFLVKAYVDAENSFGAKIRTNFSVKIRIKGEYDYTYSELVIH